MDAAPPQEIDMWLERFRRFWTQHLDALGTELARGTRERRDQHAQRDQRETTTGAPAAGGHPTTENEEDT
ncbi:hypothetical protein [Nonomuraea sp. NPDC049695]|uniref:hypothetical protein n=1 Tax=Nonomuraea sp. NPDC049695 TaxID=3154734 RepID=UPI003418B5E7